MKFLLLLCAVLIVPAFASARMMEGGAERWSIGGFYGVSSATPSDVNNFLNNQASVPKLGQLSSGIDYGAALGFMVSPRLELEFTYDQQDVKNPTNTSLGNNAGIELQENDVWGGLNFYLLRPGAVSVYVGGAVGYPIYAHAIYTQSTSKGYDAAQQAIFKGKVGIDFAFSRFVSLYFEGAYEQLAQGVLSSSGTNLTNGTSNVKMDISGVRGMAGLSFHF